MRLRWADTLAVAVLSAPAAAAADDGVYGRLDGDLALSLELGISEALRFDGGGDGAAWGESLAARFGVHYLQTVVLYAHYNDALGVEAQPLARALSGGVELRPLFLGRWGQGLERGPAHLDLLLDSIGLGLGVYGAWLRPSDCGAGCPDHGMETSLGFELPLLPQANTPFIALRGAVRWSLRAPQTMEAMPSPTGLLTLSLGYHHLFETHLVDAGDRLR